jgi:hypothetical protein
VSGLSNFVPPRITSGALNTGARLPNRGGAGESYQKFLADALRNFRATQSQPLIAK